VTRNTFALGSCKDLFASLATQEIQCFPLGFEGTTGGDSETGLLCQLKGAGSFHQEGVSSGVRIKVPSKSNMYMSMLYLN
jgi:hypothetical protein